LLCALRLRESSIELLVAEAAIRISIPGNLADVRLTSAVGKPPPPQIPIQQIARTTTRNEG
jgi:hypothetical protein